MSSKNASKRKTHKQKEENLENLRKELLKKNAYKLPVCSHDLPFATSFMLLKNGGANIPVAPGNYFRNSSDIPSACVDDFLRNYSTLWQYWRMRSWQGHIVLDTKNGQKNDGTVAIAVFFEKELRPPKQNVKEISALGNSRFLTQAQNICKVVKLFPTENFPLFQNVSEAMPNNYCTGVSFYNGMNIDACLSFSGTISVDFSGPIIAVLEIASKDIQHNEETGQLHLQ